MFPFIECGNDCLQCGLETFDIGDKILFHASIGHQIWRIADQLKHFIRDHVTSHWLRIFGQTFVQSYFAISHNLNERKADQCLE